MSAAVLGWEIAAFALFAAIVYPRIKNALVSASTRYRADIDEKLEEANKLSNELFSTLEEQRQLALLLEDKIAWMKKEHKRSMNAIKRRALVEIKQKVLAKEKAQLGKMELEHETKLREVTNSLYEYALDIATRHFEQNIADCSIDTKELSAVDIKKVVN